MARRALTPSAHRRARLSVGQAVVLGLIQGPTEVLPVSSSGHLVLVPALLGWPYARLPADVRKTFEVALHTGAGLALAWLLRDDVMATLKHPGSTALLTAPAAAVALAFEDRIEQKASDPKIAAAAMALGGICLWRTDSDKCRPSVPGAGALDECCLGVAQATALVPGVSRNGATLTAARALGYGREAAARISWRAGLPIIGGATLLKLVRLRQHGLEPELRAPFVAGAAAAFASTLAAAPLLRVRRHRMTGAYRVAFGALALGRLHRLQWPRG
jgi:undecaprenyl-diphosphatase